MALSVYPKGVYSRVLAMISGQVRQEQAKDLIVGAASEVFEGGGYRVTA